MEHFQLPPSTDITAFEQKLAKLSVRPLGPATVNEWRYYDTFDWLLFDDDLTLCCSDGELTLTSLSGSTKTLSCSEPKRAPFLVDDLPDGKLRRRLVSIVESRALLVLAAATVTETRYAVLDDQGEPIAHFLHSTVRASSLDGTVDGTDEEIALLSIKPQPGRRSEARRLAKALKPGARTSSSEASIFLTALAAAGRTPGDYSAKLDFELAPDQRADDAARVILQHLLATIRANVEGVRQDIDIEFLHDFRVAIRRTRSALSQIPGVFPAAETERFKADFRTLGKFTNVLRDLDVYLQAEPAYHDMLPAEMQDDITPIFDYMRSQREDELAKVITTLDAAETVQILNDWTAFLQESSRDDPTAPNAATPVIKLARAQIYKRYRRIIKRGNYILKHTEDELLHSLRIDCKKLRYLLEFFAVLFPQKRIGRLVKDLKVLQDNLGSFTDLTVQQATLLECAEHLSDQAPETRKALIATGVLVGMLHARQQRVKDEFAAAFAQFSAPTDREEYRSLFRNKKRKKK